MILLALPFGIYLGLSSSSNMGEPRTASPVLGARLSTAALEVSSEWSPRQKVESGQGWRWSSVADARLPGRALTPVVGLGYTVRDGGVWRDDAVWARAGLEVSSRAVTFTALGRKAFGTLRDERGLEGRLRYGGRLALELRGGVVRFDQSGEPWTGSYLQTSVVFTPHEVKR